MYLHYILVAFLTEWLTGTQLTLYFVEANSQWFMDPGDGTKTTTNDDIARETTTSSYERPSRERDRTTQSHFKLPAEVFGEAGLEAFCRTLIMVHTTSTYSPPPSTTTRLPSSEQKRSTEDWSFGEDIRQRASSTAKPPEAEIRTNQTIISTSPKLLETTITGITSSTPYPSTPSAPPTTTPFNIPTEPQTIPVIKSTSPKLNETTIIQSTTPHPSTPYKTPISTPGPPPKISGETITNPEILSTSPKLPENIIFQTTTPNPSTSSMTHTTTPGRPPKVSDDTVKTSVRISTSPKLLKTTIKTTTSYPPTPHMTPKSTLSNILMTTYRSRTPQSSDHIPLVTETTEYTHNSEYTTPIKEEPPRTKSSHTTFRQTPFTNTNKNIMVTEEDFITDGSTIVDIPKRGTSTTKEINNKTSDDNTNPSTITSSKASFSPDYNTNFKTSFSAIHTNMETTRMGVASFAETSQIPTNTNPPSTPTKTSTHASSITEKMKTTTMAMSVLHYTSMTKWLQTQSNTFSTPTSIKPTVLISEHSSYTIPSRPITSTVMPSDMPHLQSTDQSEIVNVQSTFSASHTLPTTTKPKLRNETLLSTTLKIYETSQTNSNSAIKTITTTPLASQTTELVIQSRKTKSTNSVSTPSKYVATTELKTEPTTIFHHNEVTTENIKSTQNEEAQTTLTNIESTPTSHKSMNIDPLPTQTQTRQTVSTIPAAATFTTLTETAPTLYTETKTTEMLILPTILNTLNSKVNKNESSTISGTSLKSNTKLGTFSKNSFKPQPTSTSSILPTNPHLSTTVSLTDTTPSYILPAIKDHTITRQTKMTTTQHIGSTIVKSTYHDTLTHTSTTTLKSTSTQTNRESEQQTSQSLSTRSKAFVTTPSVSSDTDVFTTPPINPSVADMFTPPIHWSFSTPLIGGPNDPDLYDPLVRQALFEMYCQESTSTPYIPSPTKSDFINSVKSSHSHTMSTRILLVWILWFYG